MKLLLFSLLSIVFLLASATAQDTPEWHDDYAVGAAEAKEKGKDLLLVFTGTDWIEMCEVFHREILTQPEFLDVVSEKFVLVKLEYPQNNRLPRQEATQKQFLRDAYGIKGFPTVVLTNFEGRPFGFNGYQPVSPEEYAETTMAMHANHEKRQAEIESSKSLEGVEKATALASGLPELPGNMTARFYREILEEILEADPENTLASTRSYRKMMADVDYGVAMQKLERDVRYGEMIELTEHFIAENALEGAALQKALMIKASVQKKQSNTPGMIETLLEVVKIDSKTKLAEQAQVTLDKLRAEKLTQDLAP